ncbi:hypothetical protein PVAND_006975 [Polypedilum vanderplanki]|uniref:Uncharacterized protein n=1 Tax=Polypedilum vanderplanki TaxID=319348 RepID=A0A9J6C5U1_POLVA|nr:hypothetical protein PVAND_006975 [Polypedilum vanderplanki]
MRQILKIFILILFVASCYCQDDADAAAENKAPAPAPAPAPAAAPAPAVPVPVPQPAQQPVAPVQETTKKPRESLWNILIDTKKKFLQMGIDRLDSLRF